MQFKTSEANLWWQTLEPVALCRRQGTIWGKRNVLYLHGSYTFVETHLTMHFKSVHFTVIILWLKSMLINHSGESYFAFLSLIRKDFTFEQDLDGGIGCFLLGTQTKGKDVKVWESMVHGKQKPQGCVWKCVGRENRKCWEARKSGWDQIVKDFEWHTLSNKDKKNQKVPWLWFYLIT